MDRIAQTGAPSGHSENEVALRMIDYVQSVIAAVPPRLPYAGEVTDGDWSALTADVTRLFRLIGLNYPMARTAFRQEQDPHLDMELEAFQVKTELLWVNVRGDRYQTQEREALLEVLAPHSQIIERLFGIDAPTLAVEAEKIQTALTHGLNTAANDFTEFRRATLEKMMEQIDSKPPNSADIHPMAEAFAADPELEARGNDVMGRMFGFDLFDVEKNSALPKALIDQLTWSPGEETTFFAEGDDRGWPLRVWPTMRRPFIRIDGRSLCFDRYSLFDHLYRTIQRSVLRIENGYGPEWNARQQAITETLPFEHLEKLLPGGRVVRPVYYRWAPEGGRAEWYEADGLIAYDDHLFIVEVKAGAFTWTSPTTDLPAHLASLRALVLSPAEQGRRFLDYLGSAPNVPLYNQQHREIDRLSLADFRHVTLCAVTLDSFTELAAKAQHLASIGIEVGPNPVWVLSIDDLRTYADMFDDPLSFLHFVEQRIEAANSKLVELDDELDHLGLYFKENHYAHYALELSKAAKGAKPRFNGYRTPIDEYYEGIARGEHPPLPKQPLPARLAEILSLLSHSNKAGRSQVASFLLDASGHHRDEIERVIESSLVEQKALGRARPVSTYGEHAFSLQIWSLSAPRNAAAAVEHVQTVVAAAGERSRFLLELVYGPEDILHDVHWQCVGLGGLANDALARAHFAGEALKQSRLRKASVEGKIGVNDPCPCGSGRKYKRCHGR